MKILGILGGGQLGRMTALAAARLGITCVVFCPEGSDTPAGQVVSGTIQGTYNDYTALAQFASLVDGITYEFENIPVETVRYLTDLKPVHPNTRALEISQDRGEEKAFLNSIGLPTTQWTVGEILSSPCVIKTLRCGYDGKGQRVIRDPISYATQQKEKDIQESFICEALVDFAYEISVIVARGKTGEMIFYGPMRNEHEAGILRRTYVPFDFSCPVFFTKHKRAKIQGMAFDMAQKIAQSLDLIGILAVEMFVTHQGDILINEIAPRPHNSGHWSIDACTVSQFENHVRAVMGLPLITPYRHSNAVMHNLIGFEVFADQEKACVHWYGKREAREGRKMGHVTILSPKRIRT